MPGAYCRYCDHRCFVGVPLPHRPAADWRECDCGALCFMSSSLARSDRGNGHRQGSCRPTADTAPPPTDRPAGAL